MDSQTTDTKSKSLILYVGSSQKRSDGRRNLNTKQFPADDRKNCAHPGIPLRHGVCDGRRSIAVGQMVLKYVIHVHRLLMTAEKYPI